MSFAEVLRRYGKSILTVIVVLVAGYFLGQQVWLGTTLEYKFDSDAVRFAKVELPYSEITDVQYLESIPALSNRVGTSFGKYRSGTFTVEGIGRGQLWAKDVSKPALLLRNAETFYIITPEDAQDKYQEVKTKVSETTR